MRTDATGRELSASQSTIADAYDALVGVLREHRDELAPFEERGVLAAVVRLWHVLDGLDCDPEPIDDLELPAAPRG